MGLEATRQSIVTAVEAVKSGAPTSPLVIEYDNRIVVDTQTQTLPFLVVNVVYFDGFQADLGDHPIQRIMGQIHIIAAVKEGSGSAKALALLDYFIPAIQRKSFGSVRTYMSKVAPMKPYLGWCYYPALIPFWFDEIR